MNRLFTFGCSFTNFFWPTWADILGREFDQFENWGRNGAGNCFQLYSLTECHKRNQITKDDTVIVMWSSIDREDRWINGNWFLEGGIYNGQEPYTAEYVEKFADPTGFLIRDLAIISSVRIMLENIGCKWYFLSMVPFNYQDLSPSTESKNTITYDIDKEVLNLYKDDIKIIKPSIYQVVFNNDWYSRPGYVDLEFFRNSYQNLAGPDWPSVKDFIKQNFKNVSKTILNEIYKTMNLDKHRIRTDTHPIPLEHLEYLDKVLPEIKISSDTRNWVTEINSKVLNLDPYYANNYRNQTENRFQTIEPKERF